jgi:hypothetical protein
MWEIMSTFDQDDDASHLLSLLHAHGQSFLTSFDTSAISYSTSNNDVSHDHADDVTSSGEDSEDEWEGVGSAYEGELDAGIQLVDMGLKILAEHTSKLANLFCRIPKSLFLLVPLHNEQNRIKEVNGRLW